MAWDIRSGNFSEPELAVIPYAVHSGETVIDIGANYGLYTYHLSRAVGPTGTVHSFEPVPFTFSALRKVVRILGIRNAELHRMGCGSETGELEFVVPTQGSGAISAGQSHIASRIDDREGKEEYCKNFGEIIQKCAVVRLEDYLTEVENVSFVKSDTEGADLFALRGASRLIDRHHPTIVCEVNPWFLEGYGVALKDMTDFLGAHAYEVYRYIGDRSQGHLIAMGDTSMDDDNYVFIHPSRLTRFERLLSG
jgi:FkbM family methyltransferase